MPPTMKGRSHQTAAREHMVDPGAATAGTERQRSKESGDRQHFNYGWSFLRGSSPIPGCQVKEVGSVMVDEEVLQLLSVHTLLLKEHRDILLAGRPWLEDVWSKLLCTRACLMKW